MKENCLVVITGASSGIGKALAIEFAKKNNPLLLISRHISTTEEIRSKNVIYAQADVSDYSALEKAIRKAEEKYGPTGCLINNAGTACLGSFETTPIDNYSREIDVLFKGVLNGIKIVLPLMSKQKFGTIINISSIGDRKPATKAIAYNASKHAVRSLSESLQKLEAKNNLRVINIAPGFIKTHIQDNLGITFAEYCEHVGSPTFIEAKELAKIIMFCWEQPQHICIRDIVIMPTDSEF